MHFLRNDKRWRLGALGALSLTVLVVAAGALAEPAKRLSVQTLKLVDREGKERIVLTAEEGIPDMTFLDPSGKSRLTLGITQDRIPVLLFSESGEEKNGLTLGFGEEEGPMLQYYDSKGKKRIAIAAPPQGEALPPVPGRSGEATRPVPLRLGGRDLDLEWLILDSTVVQAHFDARGLPVSSTPTTRCRARWVYEIPVSFNGRDYYEG